MNPSQRILIVDDNINFCKTMAAILIQKGYEVAIAHSGSEALQQIKSHLPDIIFLDIKMPTLNGVETFEHIKKINPHITVIMMTGYAVEDLVQKALKEGAYTVLYKPFDFNEVLSLIDSIKNHDQNLMTLLVDDDYSTCTIFKNLLSKKGYSVSIAHTGEEAIARTRKECYDVIFIDMKLPTMNGLDTYFSIRKHNPQVIVIMITAYHQEMRELIDEALSHSAYTWFQKPLDMQKIFAVLDQICQRKQGVYGNG